MLYAKQRNIPDTCNASDFILEHEYSRYSSINSSKNMHSLFFKGKGKVFLVL